MALNTSKCNYLTLLHFKGLIHWHSNVTITGTWWRWCNSQQSADLLPGFSRWWGKGRKQKWREGPKGRL